MGNTSLKTKTFGGLFWKFSERICAQLVTMVVSIILARILTPDDYSIVSVVTIFFTFCNIFISGGLNTALIQKKDADDLDYSTILWTNLGFSVILYIVMFFTAPWIASLYGKPILIPVIRVMALTFFINSVKSVVSAKISKELQFRKFFLATIVGTVISAGIGILMAIRGYGPWAIVAQQMSNSFIDTLLLLIVTRFRFHAAFSRQRLKPLFRYGGKLMLASLISTSYNEVRPLAVGIKFSTQDLAFYSKGGSFPKLLYLSISDTLSSVMFPVMTRAQDDKEQILAMTRRFIQVCSYVIFAVMFGLFATADNFILILLTEKWADAIVYVRIFCVSYMLTIIQDGNLQPIRAIGRSDVILKLDIVKKTLYSIVLAACIVFSDSPVWLALVGILNALIATVINTTANRKLFGYRLRHQILDLTENLLPALIMCGAVMAMNLLKINLLLLFILQIIVGVSVFVGISILFRNRNFYYLLDFLRHLLHRGKRAHEDPSDSANA